MASLTFAMPMLALTVLGGMTLLSSLYVSVAADVTRHTLGRSDASQAAVLATRLAPWRSFAHQHLAQSLSARADIADAVRAAETAVRLSPADGRTWAYLARLHSATAHPDVPLIRFYRMALAQSANAPDIHLSIAIDGVLRWRHGDDELRKLWQQSMRFSIGHDRKGFLTRVVRLGRDPYWCAAQSSALPIVRWCGQMRKLRLSCIAAQGNPRAQAWCGDAGLTPSAP